MTLNTLKLMSPPGPGLGCLSLSMANGGLVSSLDLLLSGGLEPVDHGGSSRYMRYLFFVLLLTPLSKYNYLLSAALDGGSQIILFILSFAVFGAGGNSIAFPFW